MCVFWVHAYVCVCMYVCACVNVYYVLKSVHQIVRTVGLIAKEAEASVRKHRRHIKHQVL